MKRNYLIDGLYNDGLESNSFGAAQTPAGDSKKSADRPVGPYAERVAGPIYTNDRDNKLRAAVDSVLDKLKKYFKDEIAIDVDLADFTGVRVGFGDPEKYVRNKKEKRSADTGLILGLYDPETKEVVINSLYDEDEKIGRDKGLTDGYFKPPSLERVLAEELIHHLQNKYGSMTVASKELGDRARGYIEGSAASIAEEALKEPTQIYREWKRDYLERVVRDRGRRDGFLKPVPV